MSSKLQTCVTCKKQYKPKRKDAVSCSPKCTEIRKLELKKIKHPEKDLTSGEKVQFMNNFLLRKINQS